MPEPALPHLSRDEEAQQLSKALSPRSLPWFLSYKLTHQVVEEQIALGHWFEPLP